MGVRSRSRETSTPAVAANQPLVARRTPRGARAGGQVIVIFAMALTVIAGAAGIAFDMGRFYVERRFLQNATDAAALAGANALTRGWDTFDAWNEARRVLNRNLLNDPNGLGTRIYFWEWNEYTYGHWGDPSYLTSGVIVTSSEVRVAVEADVGYTFGRVLGLNESRIGARSLVRLRGDLLPVAVRHYINAPGPTRTASYPCDGDPRGFQDLVATADTACLGSESEASLRADPSAGAAFNPSNPNDDPSHHGPIITLVGQGAQPSNMASFRGAVVLDIRNFSSATSNVFYNGVTASTQPNVLKDFEANWVLTGYPGPNFPPATMPPDPNDQVALIDGNESGIVVDNISKRYAAGDEVLCAVYSGTVMTIPDFALAAPYQVNIGTTEIRDGAVSMSLTKNNAFTGTVEVTALADFNDPMSPLATGTLLPITFTPNPATPATAVTWATFQTLGAPAGIFTVWILTHSSSPYLTDHWNAVGINVGGVARDFTSDGNFALATETAGSDASGTITFSTPNNSGAAFNGTVSLSLEGGPGDAGLLPAGIGSASISPSSFTLNSGDDQAVAITVNSGSLGAGEYPLTIRATGTNGDGLTVTHLVPMVLDVATAGTTNKYVDIMGFTVFRISEVNPNSIDGYAITPVIADMNDPRLRRAQVARLVPWS